MSDSNPGGRPPKFKSVEELQEKINAYFKEIEAKCVVVEGAPRHEPVTITGLCLHLDTTRETLMNYENNPMFTDTVKKAKMRVENYAERMLHIGRNQTGAIFALKNFGWADSQNVNLGGQQGSNPVESSLTVTFVKP